MTPIFSWSGGCGITEVAVYREPYVRFGVNQFLWGVQALDERVAVGSPIWYGMVPPRARSLGEPTALEPGQSYRVVIYAVVGGDAVAGSGEAVFTR
jgi:hypothetical protein